MKAKVIKVANGNVFDASTTVTDEEVTVKKLFGPVTVEEGPIIRCKKSTAAKLHVEKALISYFQF